MQKKKRYSGIGSRETPSDILNLMISIASFMERSGYVLYSGGANGADSAFERGVKEIEHKKIFLPWKRFNNNPSPLFNVSKEAMEIAKIYHPSWKNLSNPVRRLMARNGYQVLDESLTEPVDMVICYTIDGKETGGTGQALRIAKHYSIPVYNLYYKDKVDEILSWIKSDKIKKEMEMQTWKLM